MDTSDSDLYGNSLVELRYSVAWSADFTAAQPHLLVSSSALKNINFQEKTQEQPYAVQSKQQQHITQAKQCYHVRFPSSLA